MAITTLKYLMEIPANDDDGSLYFPALVNNFTALDAHDHDGTDSKFIRAVRQTIASGSYVDTGNDIHTKVITLPSQLTDDDVTVDDVNIQFRISSTEEPVLLDITTSTSTTYTIATSEPGETYIAIYSS